MALNHPFIRLHRMLSFMMVMLLGGLGILHASPDATTETELVVRLLNESNAFSLTESSTRLVYQQQTVNVPTFEILFDSARGSSGESSYGIVIETPKDTSSAVFQLNEMLLETRGGTSLIWRGDVLADIEAIENTEDSPVQTSTKRRPERWNMTIASGIVKARANNETTVTDNRTAPDLRHPLLSLNGFFRGRVQRNAPAQQGIDLTNYTAPIVIPQGVNLNYDKPEPGEDSSGFTLQPIDSEMILLGNGFFDASVFDELKPLNSQAIEQVENSQALLNLIPSLDDSEDALDLILDFTTDADLDDEDLGESTTSLIAFLLEAGIDLDEVIALLAEDPLTSQLLVDATYNDPNGLTSLQTFIQDAEDSSIYSDFFVNMVASDPNATDLFLVVSSESNELTDAFNEVLINDPDLADIVYNRLNDSPAALDTLLAEAEASPNALIIFITTVANQDDPSAGELLLEVLATSETIAQNFLLAVSEDASTLANLQGLLVDMEGIAEGLIGLPALTSDLDAFGDFLTLLGDDETLSALLQDVLDSDPNLSMFLDEAEPIEVAPVQEPVAPVVEEQPVIEEQPIVEEAPVIEEQPIVEEQPAQPEPPQDNGGGDGGGGE